MKRGIIAGVAFGLATLGAMESCCPAPEEFHFRDGSFVMSERDLSQPREFDTVELVMEDDDAIFTIIGNDGGRVELHYQIVRD